MKQLELKKNEIELAKTKLEVTSEQLKNGELLSELKNHKKQDR